MKADTTRSTFKPVKHYNGVRMQQGRVQLDADWNEQVDITAHRVETETLDVIGSCGGPMDGAGFSLKPQGNDLQITPGRYYVDGILCENEVAVPASAQPDLSAKAPIVKVSANSTVPFPPPAGVYIAYLDVWSRHIIALDDPLIREVALGGPDTATRSKTIWQVKFLKVGNAGDKIDCLDSFPSWDDLIFAPTGQLAARTSPDNPDPNPCIVAPGAGYRRLENQLYRVEIHKSGATGAATFKWSRDNGSIVTSWLAKNNDELTVSSIGRDKVLNFASGQWIELSDDARDLLGQPGTLVRLVKAEGNVLTINSATATGSVNLNDFPLNPKVRRWDSDGAPDVKIPGTNQGWIALEDGIEIKFKAAATYNSGDYWLIPARTATGDVEWPKDAGNNPLSLAREGIEHHYCRLAVVQFDGANWSVLGDCRCLFPSLTQVSSLYYVSGDGQEAMPDLSLPAKLVGLPQPLVVGVVNPQCRDQRAKVRFKVLIGDGKVMPHGGAPAGNGKTVDILTDDAGLAYCDWHLDGVNWSQQVEATLLDAGDNPIHLPIRFNANLSVADQVAYDPGKVCASLQNQKTVQKAIDTLATLASVYHVSGDDQSVLPTDKLDPLVVVAASKCGPVAGMKVVFTVISGAGKVMPEGGPPQGTGSTVTVATDAQGLASCDWTLGSSPVAQIVEAVLQPGPNPIVPPATVRFTAQIRGAGADPGFHVKGMGVISNGALLRNNMDLGFNLLSKGLSVDCDDTVDPAAVISKLPADNPVCFVTVDIPYPFTPADRDFYGVQSACFQTIILGAQVEAKENQIHWRPSTDTMRWVTALFGKLKAAQLPQQVLTRLVLRGNSIWAKEKPEVYLDGDLFVLRTQDEVRLPSGDQRRGGDLILWFWLVLGP